jgi:hypothetical protein
MLLTPCKPHRPAMHTHLVVTLLPPKMRCK